jgi:cytoskeletal protein CcmA (bactofilin family)
MTRPTVIPRDVVVHGRLDGDGDVIVLGRIDGPLAVSGLVVIEEGGSVEGDVRASSLTVRGTLSGNGTATEGLWVDASGSVIGDLRAKRLRIANGARFRGRTYVGGNEGVPPVMTSPPPEPAYEHEPATIPPPAVDLTAEPATIPPPPAMPASSPSFHPSPRPTKVAWPTEAPSFPELRRLRGRSRPVV